MQKQWSIVTKSMPFLSGPRWGNSASLFFNEVHTVQRENTGFWGFIVEGKKSIRFAGICSKADAKDWMLCWIKLLHRFSCQPMFLLFVYFLAVPEFILLFQPVIFHICIYFPVEMVLGLQRLFAGCYSTSLPRSLLQHSFAMPFHPLPSYRRAPFELFKAVLGYCSVLSKCPQNPAFGLQGWLQEREEKLTERKLH